MPQAGGEAVVVGDHDRGVEGLEVQHHHRVSVEAGLRLQCQGDALGGLLAGPLLHAGRDGDEVEGLGQAQHHGLHSVLQHPRTHHITSPASFQSSTAERPNTHSSCKYAGQTHIGGDVEREKTLIK